LDKYPLLNTVEEATGIPKAYVALGTCSFLFLFLFFGFGMTVMCKAIGFLYPLFQSFKAIEQSELHKLKLWLTYWLVYGFFSLLEIFFDSVMSWFPLYYPLKLCFLLWCFLAKYEGATVIFEKFIRPIMERNLKELEHSFSEAGDLGLSLAGRTKNKIQSKTAEVGEKIAEKLHKRRESRLGTPTSPS